MDHDHGFESRAGRHAEQLVDSTTRFNPWLGLTLGTDSAAVAGLSFVLNRTGELLNVHATAVWYPLSTPEVTT